MKALDTNILVRFLVKDDEKQAQAVYDFFNKSQSSGELLFIPLAVVLETIWVLESVYDVSRTDILEAIKALLSMPILKFECRPVVQAFLISSMNTSIGLADMLIAQSACHAGCECVVTLDKRAAKSALFELIK